jgi:hypothetical protein
MTTSAFLRENEAEKGLAVYHRLAVKVKINGVPFRARSNSPATLIRGAILDVALLSPLPREFALTAFDSAAIIHEFLGEREPEGATSKRASEEQMTVSPLLACDSG